MSRDRSITHGQRRQRLALVGLGALVLLTVALGAWQFSRALGKQALAETYARAAAQTPLVWHGGHAPEHYRKVRLQGKWLLDGQLRLDQRMAQSRVGVEIVTPFRLTDGEVVLVNRGWLPAGQPIPVPASQAVELVPWPRFFELRATPPQGDLFQNIDAARYAAWRGAVPVAYARAVGAQPPFVRQTGIPGVPMERHLAYAATWWGMSLIGVLLCLRFYRTTRASGVRDDRA
ncbi:SURF1 family protein [Chitiniphilus purpureus]|uniref:SURF1-like protein n=1 Tax=Chitiniphilus purpureus TaxID=2981137 RepID=A0ABY6DS91_9NEIS|nr:SURF1 family protein [Chitiniphilus sp. CD1]UXY15951.1 SURF1 family protein [Chitiniphilus sp. CD1]